GPQRQFDGIAQRVLDTGCVSRRNQFVAGIYLGLGGRYRHLLAKLLLLWTIEWCEGYGAPGNYAHDERHVGHFPHAPGAAADLCNRRAGATGIRGAASDPELGSP